jgi:hypothetical protein
MFYFLPSSFIPLQIYFILGSIFLIKKKKINSENLLFFLKKAILNLIIFINPPFC